MKILKTRTFTSAVALILGLTSATLSQQAAAQAASPKVIIASQQGALSSLPAWVAFEQGFFKKRGVEAELIPSASAVAAVSAAIRGDINIFSANPSNTIEAGKNGQCFKYLTRGLGNVYNIVARKGVPLPSKKSDAFPGGLADLKGLKFGVPFLGSAVERAARLLLTQAGVNADKDITFIAVGVGATAVTALQQNQVDAMITFPPASELLPADSYNMVVDLVKNQQNSPLENILASTDAVTCDFATKQPATLLNYCKAIYDARDWMLVDANNDGMAAVLVKYLSLDPTIAKTLWSKYRWAYANPKLKFMSKADWDAQNLFNAPGVVNGNFETWTYPQCATSDPRR